MAPEFFVDRGLGKSVPRKLRELGWELHMLSDHFPDDAQNVEDEIWLDYGLRKGWTPICKDGRIRGRQHERQPIEVHQAALFYLDNQSLMIDDMVVRFHSAKKSIERAIERGGPACFAVTREGIRRTWP